jgi:hypothetical protein
VLHDVAREPRERHAEERAALFRARAERVPPGTDTKRVAAWNGLAISGLARAGSLLGDVELLAAASDAAAFVLGHMRDDAGRLLRVWAGGRAHVPAFLDDHAAMLEALLDLHRAGADTLAAATDLADEIAARFFEAAEGDFFLTPSDGEKLAHRPRADHDGATPHSTGLAVLSLLRLAALSGRSDLRDVAETVLRTHAYELERAAEAFPTLARAALVAERGPSVAVILGDPGDRRTSELAARARRVLAPDDAVVVAKPGETPAGVDAAWLAGRGTVDGKPTAYVCRGLSCSLPVTDPEALSPLPAEGGVHGEGA